MATNICRKSLDKTMGSKPACVELGATKLAILPENREFEDCDPQVVSNDDPRRFQAILTIN